MLLPETVVSKQESVHYFYNLDPNHTTLGRGMNKGHLSIKDTCFHRVLILSCIIRTPKTYFVVSVCPPSNVHVRPLTQHTPFTNNPDYNYYYFSHFSLQVCRYICDPGQRNNYYVWHTFAIKENRYIFTVVTSVSTQQFFSFIAFIMKRAYLCINSVRDRIQHQ